jgi:hypothetical protein
LLLVFCPKKGAVIAFGIKIFATFVGYSKKNRASSRFSLQKVVSDALLSGRLRGFPACPFRNMSDVPFADEI